MPEFLTLSLQVVGLARLVAVRDVTDTQTNIHKGWACTFRYEGGQLECMLPDNFVSGLSVNDVCQLWLDVVPCDAGFEYQGKHIFKSGWRFNQVLKLQKYSSK